MTPYNQGCLAQQRGRGIKFNPHSRVDEPQEHYSWLSGWIDELARMVHTLKGKQQ